MAPGSLYTLARAVLDSLVSWFAAEGIDLPARQYVHAGEIAIDCEQLVVTLSQIRAGLPGQEDSGRVLCTYTRYVVLEIALFRCVPVGATPAAAALEASAEQILADGQAIVEGLLRGWKDGDFSETCDTMRIAPLTPYGPEGGYGGSVVQVELELR